MLKKYKSTEVELVPVIKHKFSLHKSFQEILCRTDNWINEGSGWMVELIESQ